MSSQTWFVVDEDDSDFDEKEYRASLKTENYGIAMHQRSIVEGVQSFLFRRSTN